MGVRAWLIVVAAASLTACHGFSQQARHADAPDPAAPSWRVVERLGAARYLSPSMAGWEQVAVGGMLPAGSQISTGIGGRLIVGQAANQLSAGTNSRFILPESGGNVRQTAGWLRYRIAGTSSASFGIETPSLDLAVGQAVLDVTVADGGTEVAVLSGRVHVKTLDERRQIDLHVGYTGYAGLQGTPLALRRGPGLALESVPVAVVPALHPDRPPAAATAASAPAATAVPAVREAEPAAVPGWPQASADEQAVTVPAAATAAPVTMAASARAQPASMTGIGPHASRTAIDPGPGAPADPLGAAGPVPVVAALAPVRALAPFEELEPATAGAGAPATPEVEPASETLEAGLAPAGPQAPPSAAAPAEVGAAGSPEPLRRRFDRLTENLLDGLSPAWPALQGSGR